MRREYDSLQGEQLHRLKRKEGPAMEKQVNIKCIYSKENAIEEVLLSAFRAFLNRVVGEENEHVG